MTEMKILIKLKQLFCKHEYKAEKLHGLLNVNGLFVTPIVERCTKCGKEGKWWY